MAPTDVYLDGVPIPLEEARAALSRAGVSPSLADHLEPALFARKKADDSGREYVPVKGNAGRRKYRSPTNPKKWIYEDVPQKADPDAGADLNDPTDRKMLADRHLDRGDEAGATAHRDAARGLEVRGALKSGVEKMLQLYEYQDGTHLEIPHLFKEAKKHDPSLTHEEFSKELHKLADERNVQLERWQGGRNKAGGYGMLDGGRAVMEKDGKPPAGSDEGYPFYYVTPKKGGPLDPDGVERNKRAAYRDNSREHARMMKTIIDRAEVHPDQGGFGTKQQLDTAVDHLAQRHAVDTPKSYADHHLSGLAHDAGLKPKFHGTSAADHVKAVKEAVGERFDAREKAAKEAKQRADAENAETIRRRKQQKKDDASWFSLF